MKKILLIVMMIGFGRVASGATYYVSSSLGNDANSGTSSASPWQTLAHVNAQTFNPGDSVLFRRGDVWNESLVPLSSGASGNPIAFDAYGSGPAPNFTGYYAVPSSAWVHVVGNAWKAPLPSTYTTVNFCLFGTIWGQKVSPSSSNLTAQWDFYLANGYLYVFSVGNPSSYYGSVAPMALSNVPVINVNSKSWLTFQHILVNWFDDFGVYVQGTSDHLVFANTEADSMIPQGTQPLGFYVHESAPGPGDIKIYNSSAHMNYDAYRFDGSATAITMTNDNGYANRDSALVDNTSAVSYSYCHFYASSLAVAGSTDVTWTSGTGPIAGVGNIAVDTPAAVQAWQRYPAEITLTVDDEGMTPGADTYYSATVLPIADSLGVPVGAAITVGYTGEITPMIPEIQGWINAGRDVTSHSVSHTYYTNTDALDIQYTGSGTAATLSISNKVLTITVTGASDSVSYNLAQGAAQGTMAGLNAALTATGKFTASYLQPCQGPYGTGCSFYTNSALLSQDLADVTSADVKTSQYHLLLDVTRLTTDEITLSRQWMQSNLTGLPATPVYVYPGGYETSAMQGITAGVPYAGARGALKEDLGVKDTYASGFDGQNVTSFGVNPSWMGSGGAGVTPAQLNQKIQALVWKEKVWGLPWGIFWHLNELVQNDPVGGNEITNLLQDLKNAGATIQTNTSLVNWLMTGTLAPGTGATDGNYYYKIPALSSYGANGGVDFRPTASSPVVDSGLPLGAAYAIDINGVNQNSFGTSWEIGAHVYVPATSYGTGTQSSYFTIGEGPVGQVQLPQNWVNSNEWVGTGANTIAFPSSGTGGAWTCGATNYGPYTAGSQASLQQAVNDAEACRAANGSGTTIVVPAGTVYSGAAGVVLPQTAGDTSTSFIVLTSSGPLTTGQTACSHGTQDNVAESTQPGIRNLSCNGTSLSYQLGTTVTSVSGSFTLANGIATSASAYNDIASMYTFECTGTNCNALSTASFDSNNVGPHNFAILNAEIRPQAGLALTDSPVKIGLGTETLTSQLASHIHFAYDYVHSDWTDASVNGGVATGSPTGANSLPNDIYWASCTYCSISYSYVDRSIRPGAEGHVLAILYGQQLKIDHNWFEGQSSGRFCGGQSVTLSLANFLGCTDGEERGNRFTYPYSWLLAWQGNFCVNSLTCSGNGYERKNGSEFKNVQRWVSDGNIYENVDNSGAQNGTTYSVKTANGSGGVTANNYWLTAANLTTTNNIFRSSCNGPSWGDTSTIQGANGNGTTLPTQLALWQNNLLYNVNTGNPGCTNGGGTTNSSTPQYGFRNASSAGSAWTASATRDAAGLTSTLTLTSVAGGTQSDVNVGDPVQVTCPNDTSFSTSLTSLGPPALSGTSPSGLTVVYGNTGTANATTSGCTFQNGQGYANYLTYNHNSNFLTNASFANDPYNSAGCGTSTPYVLARNTTYTNSIFVGGGINSSCGEGTRTESKIYDVSTEQVNYLALPGRDSAVTCPGHSAGAGGMAACYTEYSASHAAITPPVTLWGTEASFCTGNDPTTGNCVGVLGAMNASSFPAVLNDWNQYRLCHAGDAGCDSKASLYAAGGTDQASDGTDQGAAPAAINAAQVSTLYLCGSACGTGPFGDLGMKVEILAPGAGANVPAVNQYLKPSPYINAIIYSLWWSCSDQDGTAAHYTWTGFDNQVLSDGWAAAGKKIIVVLGGVTYGGSDSVCYGGGGWGTTGVGNYATPSYVWTALGAANYATCSGSGGSQQVPNYLSSAYSTNYQNWVTATLAHLATSSYGSAIEYVRVAWGKGGETTPFANWDAAGTCPDASGHNTLTTDWGYTLAGWESFLQSGMSFEAGLGSGLQLMISITPMGPSGGSQAVVPNFTAPIAASLHVGFGTQGLMASDVNNSSGCGGNWCQLFSTYKGRVPLETQTFFQSCATTNESGTCPSMAVTTGALDPLLTWAELNHVTTFEMYYEDACSMLCPGYSQSGYAAYPQPGYLAALANAVGGKF